MNKNTENEVKSDKRHVCQTCGSSFNRPYRLTQHLLLHQNIKIFQCGEEGCDKSYTSKSHLDRHLYSVHIKPDFGVVHRCPECMKTFSNRQNLKRHMKIKHDTTKNALKCDICRKDFKKKHLLSSHMYYHTLVKPFSCELCSQEFISLFEKKKHMKNHKTYNCEHCDMAFDRWSKYQKHKKTEHNVKEYKCNDCGRSFKKREHIVRHVRMHMLTRKPKLFKCWYEDCNRVYCRHSNLKQHIEIKHIQEAHVCEICDMKLSSKTTYKKHLKTHCKPEDVRLNHYLIRKHPKTKETGRKERKDKGAYRNPTIYKIAGLLNGSKLEDEIKNTNQPTKHEANNIVEERIDSAPNAIINISLEHIDKTEAKCMTTDVTMEKVPSEPQNSVGA